MATQAFPELPDRTVILGNTVDVGSKGMRLIGLGWLLGSVAFVALAAAALLRVTGWQDVAYVVLGLSLILCILGWPAARIGVPQTSRSPGAPR